MTWRERRTGAKPMTKSNTPVLVEGIVRAILVLRGHKVLLDTELAALYDVSVKRFNEQARRNRQRFPADFMFQLTAEEIRALRSQIATLKSSRGQHRKYLPYAFTEQGVAMLSSVLRSGRAIAVNIQIMRAFVRMRELLISNRELAEKLDQLEARLEKKLASHDEAIAAILSAIRELMNPTPPKRRGIGFTAEFDEK
jgi:phage regulator Rha-like protein